MRMTDWRGPPGGEAAEQVTLDAFIHRRPSRHIAGQQSQGWPFRRDRHDHGQREEASRWRAGAPAPPGCPAKAAGMPARIMGLRPRWRGAASRRLRRSPPCPPRDRAVLPPAGAMTEMAKPMPPPAHGRSEDGRTPAHGRSGDGLTLLRTARKRAVRRSPGRIWPEVHAPGTMRGLALSGSRHVPRSGLAGIMPRANTGRRQASTGRRRARFRPGPCGY